MSLFFLMPTGKGVTVTLSGATVAGTTGVEHGIIIRTDGTLDETKNGVVTQLSQTSDWIIPNTAATTAYQFRVTNVVWTVGTAFSTAGAADDVWVALTGGDLSWLVQDTISTAAGNQSVTFDLEVRLGTGTTLSSASYTLTADYEV